MIHFVTYLDRERWRISVYVLEHCGEGSDVIEALSEEGCKGADLADAYHDIRSCAMNIGITYSYKSHRNTIMLIGLQESKSEFVNTLRHEQHHIIAHICETDGIDMYEEPAAYIAGDVGEAIYEKMCKYRLL